MLLNLELEEHVGKSFITWAAALVALLVISSDAGADVLFQSAKNVLSGSFTDTSGVETGSSFYSGANFQVTAPVHVSAIGGDFGNEITLGNNQIFGAIVPVANLTAAPVPPDLSSNVLASTLITLPAASVSGDVSGAVSLDLSPGFYGVIFGAGKFGATGDTIAVETLDQLPANTQGSPTYAIDQSSGTMYVQAPGARYFVDGTVPEPASMAILAGVGSWMGARRRRH